MVGLVVVSHSAPLARAAVALALEMVPGSPPPVQVAAGLDDGSLGTDATAIVAAIEAADASGGMDGMDGVVVLMDLGSAVLSAELACELLAPDLRARVLLSAAPLVEGLVVAVVAAAGGAGRVEVAAEAMAALAGKAAHLGAQAPQPQPDDAAHGAAAPAGSTRIDELGFAFEVTLAHGLHARPAALLVAEARRHDAQVSLRNLTTGAGPVSAGSLSRVATLGAALGHQVAVTAVGRQALEAVEAVLALARRGFGETLESSTDETLSLARRGTVADRATLHTPSSGPLPASPGIGIGPVLQLRTGGPLIPRDPEGDPAQERARLRRGIELARAEVGAIHDQTRRDLGEDEAAIFRAYLMFLDDEALLDDAAARIGAGWSAPAAWAAATGQVAAVLGGLSDPYLRGRAADVEAVGQQVVSAMLDGPLATAGWHGVLVAPDLSPAQAALLDRERVAGIVLAAGGPTAHSAILARAHGIPAIVGAGPQVLDLANGTIVALDGGSGELVVTPSDAVRQDFERRGAELARRRARALEQAEAPARTSDGVRVLVGANLGSVQDAGEAFAQGAELAGLVRTEFLFLGRRDAPTVAEQAEVYRDIAAAMGGRRITLRTLDIGGDKPLEHLSMPPEANPFLGVRGLRLSLARPALLADQLAAIVAVARETPVDVMFPMVSTLEELLAARTLLDEAINGDRPPGLRVGIMIEVPAAALKAAAFAPNVDFVSIGTNDLTQYALAADRGNPGLTGLADPLDPGVLALLDAVCRGVGDRVPVAVCGELAADVSATALLIGLGVRELSVSPLSVPLVKQAVREVDAAVAQALACEVLGCASAQQVRALLARPR